MNKSTRYIRILSNELEQAGLIEIKRSGFNKTNTYFLKLSRKYSSSPSNQRKGSSAHIGKTVPKTQGTVVPPNRTSLKEKDNTEIINQIRSRYSFLQKNHK